MCFTCSVSSTEELLYLQLVSEPSVASRNRKRMRDEAHTISSQFVRDSRNVLWLCRSWGRAKATLFTLLVLVKRWISRILCLSFKAHRHSGNMIRWLHVVLMPCYLISMQESQYFKFFIRFVSSKQLRSDPADMTDLGANDEWNGKCQQEDGGDNDVNRALWPSSLQWTSKSMTQRTQTIPWQPSSGEAVYTN